MSFLSRHIYKIIIIAIMLSVCLAAWVALAGLVAVSQTDFPDRVSQWWEGRTAATLAQQSTPVATDTPPVAVEPPLNPPETGGREGKTAERLTPDTGGRQGEAAEPLTPDAGGWEGQVDRTGTPIAVPLPVTILPDSTPHPATPETAATSSAAMVVKPTATPTITHTPPPSPTPTRATFNLILLGSDRNIPGKGTWRTDVMALTVMDKETREVGVLAIPRDLYVSIPGHPPERLNTVDFLGHYTKYPGGGPALLNRTLRQNFGFGFDRFIRVDFTGFVELIDILGGIDVDVDCPFEERFAEPDLPGGRLLKLEAGLQHLDGHTALMYVRSRLSTSDLDRSRRQFKVLMALREKILQLNTLLLIPQLWNNYHVTVQTDLSLGEALDLARLAYEFETKDIHGRVIDTTMTIPGRTAMKSWILLPEHNKIKKAYDEIFSAPSLIEAGEHRGKCP